MNNFPMYIHVMKSKAHLVMVPLALQGTCTCACAQSKCESHTNLTAAMEVECVQESVSLPAQRGSRGLKEEESNEAKKSIVIQVRDKQLHESLALLLVRSWKERERERESERERF